jgi:lipopolysaccharide assembly protein A
MFSLIVVAVMLIIVLIFSVQNAGPVAVSFLSWRFEASLAIVIALSLLGGMVAGMTMLSWVRLRRSHRKKKAPVAGPADPGRPS